MVFSNNRSVSQWKTPLNLSLGFHIFLLTSAVLMPSFIERRPLLPEFHTVQLVNVAEIAEQMPTTGKQSHIEPVATKTQKPDAAKVSETSIPESPAAAETAPPVSLRPAKKKIKKAVHRENRKIEDLKKTMMLERRRAEAALEKSRKNASRAAQDAVESLRDALRTDSERVAASSSTSPATNTQQQPAGGPAGGGGDMDQVLKEYYAQVYQKIQAHWYLPPLQNWEDSLEAVMIIKVDPTGRITRNTFEKKSANIYFNQFLMKTVREASPLPSFPEELEEPSLEIGLRFTPAGVF